MVNEGFNGFQQKTDCVELLLIVYDALGRNVNSLVNEYLNPSSYKIIFDKPSLVSGVYYPDFQLLSPTETFFLKQRV